MFSCLVSIHSKFRVYIKEWPPTRGSGATVGLICSTNIRLSTLGVEQHVYSSDPRPDTVSLMQLESRRAVPHALQPLSKAWARTFKSTTRRPRSEKPLQTSGSWTFFSFASCSITDQEAVSRALALLLRIKTLALQKCPLFVLFALAGRTAAILDVAVLCAIEGAQCKTRELPEKKSATVRTYTCAKSWHSPFKRLSSAWYTKFGLISRTWWVNTARDISWRPIADQLCF